MPLLLQYSLVPLLSADGPPPDAGYTHYGVLNGSIWWVCGRWGAERQHEALTKCPMDMFYIPWHSLARTCFPLSTAPDMTWRPWLWSGQHVSWTQTDTGDTSQAFFSRATQHHLTPVSLSLWIITSAAHYYLFKFFYSHVISCLFWVTILDKCSERKKKKHWYKCYFSPLRRKQYCRRFLNYIVPLSGITY